MLPGMVRSLLCVFLLALNYSQAQLTNTSDTTLANSCCAMRTVAGETLKSGIYNLKDGNDPRCPDGCLYSKDDLDVCFKPNAQYITSCDAELNYIDAWKMDQTFFSPPTIAETGDWGPDEFCPAGAFAASFQLYVAPRCDRRCTTDDDVALMGVKLYCADYNDPATTIAEITSSVMSPCVRKRGYSCDWMETFFCPEGHFARKSRYLSEYFHDHTEEEEGATFEEICPTGTICRNSTIAASDPMGGLNMDMGCTDETEISGDGITQAEVPLIAGEVTTFWSDWNECPVGYAICGIRSKVHQGESDKASNLGQTEVLFHCCQLPSGFTA